MRNIFLGKSCTKCRAKIKVPKFNLSLDQVLNFTQFVFMVCLSRGTPNMWKLSDYTETAFVFYKAFLKR